MSRYENLDTVKELGGNTSLLRQKTVTVLGLGALGSAVAEMLARMGIHLRIIDKDRVYESDFDKLSLFSEDHASKFKAKEAKKLLETINKNIKVKAFHEELVENNAFLVSSDLIIDCSNTFESTLLADSVRKKIPLIIARCGGVSGSVLVLTDTKVKQVIPFLEKHSPVFSDGNVLLSTVSLIASLTVNKALKVLLGQKHEKNLLCVNSWKFSFEKVPVKKK